MKHLQPHGRGDGNVSRRNGCADHRGPHQCVCPAREGHRDGQRHAAHAAGFVPQPLVGQTAEQLRGYIEGADPTTKRPFMVEVIEGLTKPLDQDDLKGAGLDRSTRGCWSPTPKKTSTNCSCATAGRISCRSCCRPKSASRKMLKGTKVARDKIVGKLRPTAFREFWEFDVEKVAVNAVMAGARPEYLPVILAMSASGITARSSSTTSFATLSVVNGPIRDEIGMNSGIGALGPYNHANATIGRAYSLLCQNLQGGSVPGETYMGIARQFPCLHGLLPRSGGTQPVGAVPCRARLQADRLDGQRVLRRLVHPVGLRTARQLAIEIHPLPDRARALSAAADRDGPDRGARLRRISATTSRS